MTTRKKRRSQKKGTTRKRPALVWADADGNIYDAPEFEMTVRSGNRCLRPDPADLIPMPEGTRLFTLPGRLPVGWDRRSGEFVTLEESLAVAAFPPPGYARLYLPAADPTDRAPMLPLWAYTAVGWMDGRFWIAATQVEENVFWNPHSFDDETLLPHVDRRLAEYPDNRLWEHLSRCAIDYHCFAAKNAFYRRWECPIPTSPGCNSRCVGCLSWQPKGSFEASHERITFVPTAREIVEVALPHIEQVEDAIVSFGQGCEGDPILQAEVIAEAIRQIRSQTDAGTFNINTNASRPEAMALLCEAGIDSIRVSLNSVRETTYNRYYRPVNYRFADVLESIRIAKSSGVFVSLNLLMFPGVTDLHDEIQALIDFIGRHAIDRIQMRNLSIDPDIYVKVLELGEESALGIRSWMRQVQAVHPHLTFGYFNIPRRRFNRRSDPDSSRPD